MNDRLFVSVLGNRNSGKSTTWNRVFCPLHEDKSVKIGQYERKLYLNPAEWVEVFLISTDFHSDY